ncbi:Panacea domain-containing protein [Sporomusa acidovorans]|uniref:Antitoxin SocA-like Panacea domain-containing protein n=1 Tax=Sporomusa acidovorans (strain ATCC 49682 / DSM 3132 / Mol) TaxID=1123286 RepID=A0ABZ3IVY9_SPOA4|nr:type II toxin-antitoxin system antitoxin SocA domain-containing protein [Sporomusa acidovorans]OZC13970.1 hypothetical protein SPACI_54020 [Sporomusa acidovorans DSM 3132]SDF21415.1 Uncharacterized phage-associated protein [Sporomusa acidovorans]
MAKLYRMDEALVKITIFDVANYFISLANLSSIFITHLKIQKLCYYAQAAHLVNYYNPLFNEEFQAWKHGPVCPDMYNYYKSYGFTPITSISMPLPEFDDSHIDSMRSVWDKYGSLDAKELERITHLDAPWKDAWSSRISNDVGQEVISLQSMQVFYQKKDNIGGANMPNTAFKMDSCISMITGGKIPATFKDRADAFTPEQLAIHCSSLASKKGLSREKIRARMAEIRRQNA